MHDASAPTSRRSLARVAAAAPLLGCGPEAEPSFGINGIAFDGDRTLTLTFSQPLANADAIDPNDFRISLGQTFSSTDIDPDTGKAITKQSTFYQDLESIYDYDYYEDPERFTFESAARGASANQLVLVGEGWDIERACMYIHYRLSYWEQFGSLGTMRDIGLFLHHAAGDIPLESEAGEPLADIGPEWVLSDGLQRSVPDSYGFLDLVPKWRIPCP